MPRPVLRQAQLQFVDDELLRVPMLAQQVFEATDDALRRGTRSDGPKERFEAGELLRLAEANRDDIVRRFSASVTSQVADHGLGEDGQGGNPRDGSRRLELSLLDEEEVAADVAISHMIEAIKSVAEHELREIATFAAALAGDMDMGSDHNPFRPETYARAMWDVAQALTPARSQQVRFMKEASEPLAQLLRQSYAGACARLEAAGVEPAAYRTLILPAGTRTMRPSDSWLGRGPDLVQMRDTMPAPLSDPGTSSAFVASSELPLEHVIGEADRALKALRADAPPTERDRLLQTQRSRIVRHAPRAVDQQSIELLSRLFDTILADKRLKRDMQYTLTRLQATVIRVALHDTRVLEDYAHPVWRFMDHVVHQASVYTPDSPERSEGLRLAEGLIDTLAADHEATAERFEWARERLKALDRKRLERRIGRMAPEIAMMQALEDKLASRVDPIPTGSGPLDETQLDTVPAELMTELESSGQRATDAGVWLYELALGDWVRLFRRGHWLRAQLLWQGRRGDVWLFGEGDSDASVVFRRTALARLYREGLAKRVTARSLVRSAANHLMRAVSGTVSGGLTR